MLTPKRELYRAYRGEVGTGLLPYPIIKLLVNEMKTFLLGDGYERKLEIQASDTDRQEELNRRLKELNFYAVLDEAVKDSLIAGEGYVDYSTTPWRRIRADKVTNVAYDPDSPLRVVYLVEVRDVWDTTSNQYEEVEVIHSLTQPESNADLDLLNLASYSYSYKEGDNEAIALGGDRIPILRIPNELDGLDPVSAVEDIIHAQLEYNDVRARLNEYNKHHKPQLYSVGTSMPQVIGRTNQEKPEEITTPQGAATFQTTFNTGQASILHLPISPQARDANITPKVGYAQPVDSQILERQRQIILHDIYFLTGCLLLELENARSASSSSSLAILYEPLQRKTHYRARYLLAAVELLLESAGIQDNYSIKLPNMMPRNLEAERLEIEKVKNKLISRKSYLIKHGLSVEEADKELEQLNNERTLAVQFSGSITDQLEVPNVEGGKTILEQLDVGQTSITPSVGIVNSNNGNGRLNDNSNS